MSAVDGTDEAQAARDRQAIRQAVDDWVLWRDAGEWDRLAGLWADDGYMMTTWSQAPAAEFVARSRQAFANGLKVLHSLGGCSVDLAGGRAVARTKMQILQRAPVDGVLVDVTCQGRFWDAFERRDGRWLLVFRQPIYELDQMRPVDPSARLSLDAERLAAWPEGYRHLAYLQTGLGFDVSRTLPGTRGPEIEALRARGRRWLAGEPVSCLREAAGA